MIKQGQKINYIADDKHPLKSPNTKLICAWLTCGGQLLEGNQYSYTVEKLQNGTEKLQFMWFVDNDFKVEFESFVPTKDPGMYKKVKEQLTFTQFSQRFCDESWLDANKTHPMTYVFWYKENMHKMISFLKQAVPAIKIQGPRGTAVISQNCSEEKRNQILSEIQ